MSTTTERKTCERAIFNLLPYHKKCSRKKCGLVTRDCLCGVVQVIDGLEDGKEYRVCLEIMRKVNQTNPIPPTPPRRSA